MKYKEAVDYLLNIPKFSKKTTRENSLELLKRLGDPENDFSVIHVAGTNGKGSVCAFINGLITKEKIKTGLFTSPHLVKINERIKINNQDISDEEFESTFNTIYDLVKDGEADGLAHPSFFEFLFLMAVKIFSDKNVDYGIIETGLGGRLDATNLIERPVLSIITSIGLDHTEILGETIELITKEKAGIIKKDVPLIFYDTNEIVKNIIVDKAKELNTNYKILEDKNIKVKKITDKYIDFSLGNMYYECCGLRIPFVAPYQTINASLAIMAVEELKKKDNRLRVINNYDLMDIKWEGRMEEIVSGVFLDGAHNISGIERFVQTVKEFEKRGRVSLVFSVVSDKAYGDMIRILLQDIKWNSINLCSMETTRRTSTDDIEKEFSKHGYDNIIKYSSVNDCIKSVILEKKDEEYIFIAGSLYLVGEVKEIINRTGGEHD